ncbi:MAG TPA: flagellar basal body L-ring protein FlgH [Phycisphaerae bacterium]|nr:flagellar basal body L-ring protein FlgH [Phycisphaerae bacterium]HNU46732.1 flagellar basal body L-ring protein FlgH [Phycisphaerae bacterium]
MQRPLTVLVTIAVLGPFVVSASAQTSSLGAQKRAQDAQRTPAQAAADEAAQQAVQSSGQPKTHPAYERYSWITARAPAPPTFKVHDLITVIIRENTKFEAEADRKSDTKFDLKSELEAFFKPTNGGLGASNFSRGHPNIDYKFQNKTDSKADASREDTFTTRLTAEVIDVKPNGLLVLEAQRTFQHGEDVSRITLTGTCRKEDVTADNTVLSTQLADLNILSQPAGPVHDGARRGWVSKVLDAVKPF